MQYLQATYQDVTVRASVVPAAALLAHTTMVFPPTEDGVVVVKGIDQQVDGLMRNLASTLAKVGASIESAARINLYAADADSAVAARKTIETRWKTPVSAVVSKLPQPGAAVAADAVAVATAATSPDPGNVRVLKSTGVAYISGMAAEGDLTTATRDTLKQLGGVLSFLKLGLDDVIEVKSFLRDAADISAPSAEFAKFFNANVPPATWVQWTMKTGGPIEIELVAQAGDQTLKTHAQQGTITYLTPPDTKSSPVYSRVALTHGGKLIYTSGVYAGAKAAHDPKVETRLALETLREVVKKAGGDFEHLAKATYYPSSDATSTALNQIRPDFYNPKRPPAASKAPVEHSGDPESHLTLDLIAITP